MFSGAFVLLVDDCLQERFQINTQNLATICLEVWNVKDFKQGIFLLRTHMPNHALFETIPSSEKLMAKKTVGIDERYCIVLKRNSVIKSSMKSSFNSSSRTKDILPCFLVRIWNKFFEYSWSFSLIMKTFPTTILVMLTAMV